MLIDVTAILTGPCIVNEFATGAISFGARLEFRPTVGDGLTTSIGEAAFDGVFFVSPDGE